MKGLTNFHVSKIGHFCKNFIGVFNPDTLPEAKGISNKCCILNTGLSNEKGEHFIALKMSNNQLDVYDSFGENSPVLCYTFLRRYAKRNKLNLKIFKPPLQEFRSLHCGYYAISFLHLVNHFKMTNREIAHLFQTLTSNNDDLALALVLDWVRNDRCRCTK